MLASRLGVAILIMLGLSSYISARPVTNIHVASVDMTASDEAAADDEDANSDTEGNTVKIGPFVFEPDDETIEIIHDTVAALAEQNEISHEEARLITEKFNLDRVKEREIETAALEQASRQIAHDLAALEIETSEENDAPDRLSEDEIQSLVVQRLLSVQTQMREDEDSPAPPASDQSFSEKASTDGPTSLAPEIKSLSSLASVLSPPPEPPAPAETATANVSLERVTGDFSGKTLMGTDFRNRDLSGLNFSNAKLTAAKFDGSNLTGANFTGAKIQGASFADATLTDVLFHNAQAQTAHFERAVLMNADLSQANFAGAVLTDADLRGAKMDDINLNGAVMQGTKLGDAPAP